MMFYDYHNQSLTFIMNQSTIIHHREPLALADTNYDQSVFIILSITHSQTTSATRGEVNSVTAPVEKTQLFVLLILLVGAIAGWCWSLTNSYPANNGWNWVCGCMFPCISTCFLCFQNGCTPKSLVFRTKSDVWEVRRLFLRMALVTCTHHVKRTRLQPLKLFRSLLHGTVHNERTPVWGRHHLYTHTTRIQFGFWSKKHTHTHTYTSVQIQVSGSNRLHPHVLYPCSWTSSTQVPPLRVHFCTALVVKTPSPAPQQDDHRTPVVAKAHWVDEELRHHDQFLNEGHLWGAHGVFQVLPGTHNRGIIAVHPRPAQRVFLDALPGQEMAGIKANDHLT